MDINFQIPENLTDKFQTNCLINNEIDTIYFYHLHLLFFNFIKLFFLLISGTGIAIICVSYCLYHPSKMKFEKSYNENKELYEYNPFFIEYLEEYYELDEDKDDEFLKTLSNKYISYTFDFRNKTYQIIMNYNFNDESFDYFLNDKASALTFEFLDTISRIYCVKYNCRNIYTDNYDNKEKLFDSLIPDKKEEEVKENDEAPVKNNIFYSKTKKTIKPKNKILNYSSNKFKYKGLLKEFSDLIFGFDIYDSSNNLVLNYFDLENQIFSVKKNHDYEMVQQEENNFISFKNFKNSAGGF